VRALRVPFTAWSGALGVALGLLGLLLFKHLSFPLMWHDEAATAMFGRSVLENGYPKVHGPKNTLYGLDVPLEVGVNQALDAYLGSPWLQYYVAAAAELLARRVHDPYEKTARMRLPFALAGALGLALLLWGVLPAIEGPAQRRVLFALLFTLLCCASVSLLLHLREARYYALTVLWVGASVLLFLRRHCFGSIGAGLYAALLVPLLFLLFNTFYPAFAALAAAAALHAIFRAMRGGTPRRLAIDLLPLIAAGLAVLPLVFFYRLFEVTSLLLERYDPARTYGVQLADTLVTLLRYEFLAPVIAARLWVAGLRFARRTQPISEALRRRLAASDFLSLFAVVYVLLVSRTPFFYERYFIALSPVLSATLLLDLFSGVALARGGSLGLRRARAAGLALLTVVLASVAVVRAPEFEGRLHEIDHIYRGPLDHIIPYLLDGHEHTEDLVVATNYEETSFMYYLDCRVLVGFYAPNLVRDFLFVPDVILARPWGRGFTALGRLSMPYRWAGTRFPVENIKANNTPSLSPRNQAQIVHRFRSPELPDAERGVLLLERLREE